MRHQKALKKLGRVGPHRRAMLRNMATSLFAHERILTTHGRAMALRSVADGLITLAKRGDLAARRQAARDVHDDNVLRKLFTDLAERYRHRAGGYTRVLKMGWRKGDNAQTALIELVDRPVVVAPTPAEKKTIEKRSAEKRAAEKKVAAPEPAAKTAHPSHAKKTVEKKAVAKKTAEKKPAAKTTTSKKMAEKKAAAVDKPTVKKPAAKAKKKS
jgi:large subunit ribosomal protein L17